ncbi:MAG: hypothetical protein GX938_02760, partial [Spirochaetales bacterium]|nr:hypothetical protein [Spirochaetales bacterium]
MKSVNRKDEITRLRASARRLGFSSVEMRNEALRLMAEGLTRDWPTIKAANDADVAQAKSEGL